MWSKNSVRIVHFLERRKAEWHTHIHTKSAKFIQFNNNDNNSRLCSSHCIAWSCIVPVFCVYAYIYGRSLLSPYDRILCTVFVSAHSMSALTRQSCQLTSQPAGPISILMFKIDFFYYKNEKYFSLPAVNFCYWCRCLCVSLCCVYLHLYRSLYGESKLTPYKILNLYTSAYSLSCYFRATIK